MTMFAPSRASPSAMASPIPTLAPVMTAVLLVSPRSNWSLLERLPHPALSPRGRGGPTEAPVFGPFSLGGEGQDEGAFRQALLHPDLQLHVIGPPFGGALERLDRVVEA